MIKHSTNPLDVKVYRFNSQFIKQLSQQVHYKTAKWLVSELDNSSSTQEFGGRIDDVANLLTGSLEDELTKSVPLAKRTDSTNG